VIPTRLLDAGFTFRYPNWADASRDLVARQRALSRDLASGN
jgi:NAD dependent epimerase/dehydratase family enzyme